MIKQPGCHIPSVINPWHMPDAPNPYALMLEVGGGVNLGIIDEVRRVGDIEFTATLNVQVQPLVFPQGVLHGGSFECPSLTWC